MFMPTLLLQIIPAIKEKWPAECGQHVRIQQDNARPHIKDNDPLFREASIDGGLTFTLVQQPPNSPDLNVLDLGWFAAIQALQYQKVCHTVVDLVKAVERSYEELTTNKLNNVFLTLQSVMVEVLVVRGQNRYKLPHLGKDAMIRADTLPLSLYVSKQLGKECLLHLLEFGLKDVVEVLSKNLGINLTEVEEE